MAKSVVLRQVNVDDVMLALRNSAFEGWPQDEDDLIEFFEQMLVIAAGDGGEGSGPPS